MDAIPLISIAAQALVELWRIHSNKPPGWEPSAEDWDALLKHNQKTAEDYERGPSSD
jgi:hypothetical protein